MKTQLGLGKGSNAVKGGSKEKTSMPNIKMNEVHDSSNGYTIGRYKGPDYNSLSCKKIFIYVIAKSQQWHDTLAIVLPILGRKQAYKSQI